MGISDKSKSKSSSSNQAPNHNNCKIQLIPIRASPRPIRITNAHTFDDDNTDTDCCSTTPTSEESRIPSKACPPPPPRKQRKTASGCTSAKDFFCPPDLDTVFIRRPAM